MSINPALEQIRDLLGIPPRSTPIKNVNQLHDDSMSLGQKVADSVARNMGSWRFVIIQSLLLFLWIAANVVLAIHDFVVHAWDPYPFILLNLALSFQAGYAAPFIMMSQNRQADKDRLAAEHDYMVNIRSEVTVRAVLEHLKAQDDVIVAILRQIQASSGLTASDDEKAAEKHLQEVAASETEMLTRTIQEEEAEAGLSPA